MAFDGADEPQVPPNDTQTQQLDGEGGEDEHLPRGGQEGAAALGEEHAATEEEDVVPGEEHAAAAQELTPTLQAGLHDLALRADEITAKVGDGCDMHSSTLIQQSAVCAVTNCLGCKRHAVGAALPSPSSACSSCCCTAHMIHPPLSRS